MKRFLFIMAAVFVIVVSASFGIILFSRGNFKFSDYLEPQVNIPKNPLEAYVFYKFPNITNWERPSGKLRVGLQIGHLEAELHPDELENLRSNFGTSAAGIDEVGINEAIVEEVAKFLEEQDIKVDILPATVPPAYWADAFVSIHADGNENINKRGFKVATSWFDYSQKSKQLAEVIEKHYEKATNLPIDPEITANMKGYYAFRWWRYEHTIHPMTPAVIVEVGFLTNRIDRTYLIDNYQISARAISEAIIEFLEL